MPGGAEKQFVMNFLLGMKEFFEDNPSIASQAGDMWSENGTSVAVLEEIIQQRCKEKAAAGEESRLAPFNTEDGATRLRKLILAHRDDDDVAELLEGFMAHKRK
mmetsp:Transcript_6070/g.12117  ORF Transcript_6070/g.12117 Transcript_6070/m.12117 type:complete len:104 (+) Transcript_6070:13-324(+)